MIAVFLLAKYEYLECNGVVLAIEQPFMEQGKSLVPGPYQY